MQYQAKSNHVAIRTIGLNVQIIKDPSDLNNVRYLVVLVKRWNDKQLIANCGNYDDSVKFAHRC